MANDFHQNAVVMDKSLKTRRLTFEISVTASATAANKVVASDLPGVCLVATEGLLTPVTDVEAISGLTNYTAPDDSDGILDVMLKGSELGTVSKVQLVEVREKVSAGFSSPTVQCLGTSQGLTSGGNIVFEIDTATDLSSTDTKFTCDVVYLLSE